MLTLSGQRIPASDGETVCPCVSVTNKSESCDLGKCEDAPLLEENILPKSNSGFRDLSRKKKYLLCFCVLSHFMSGLSTSLLAPFYPQVAQRKGMSLTLIGVTFCLFPMSGFILAPIFGSFMTRIGPKFMVVSGIFVGGVCNILYGTLDKCPDGTPFIVISLACRLAEGIGFIAYCVSIFTIVSTEFSNNATTAISLLQTSSELGLMLGPGIGGFLYDLGGFGVPFYTAGIAVVLNGFVLYFTLPDLQGKGGKNKVSAFSFLRSGLSIAAIASLLTSSIGISFLEATLANHLASLSLSTSMVGLLFTIVPCLFIITSPLYGFLTDTKELQSHLMVIGLFVFGLGFFFVGPGLMFPFFHLNSLTIIPGLVLIGASFGCACLPPFKCLYYGAVESGMDDNRDTHAMVASTLNSMYFFGAFLGPLVGNALIEQKGPRFGYTVTGSCCLIASGLCLLIFATRHVRRSGKLLECHSDAVKELNCAIESGMMCE